MVGEIVIEAPAKINLTLDVLGKREDGYHELETVMHQIDLVDIIHLKPCPQGISVESNSGAIPNDENNLAYRAASLILKRYPDLGGIQIFIDKRIPVGAGLAGGSTDAAAVLLGLNRLYQLGMNQATLLEQATLLGSDVPFCLTGGTALARGKGELLTPLSGCHLAHIVLVKPDFQLSTADVYGALDLSKVSIRPHTTAFLEAWTKCDIISIVRHLGNILENVSIKKHPELEIIRQEMLDLGALGTVMSGSGPTMLGIFAQSREAASASQWFSARYQEVYMVSSYDRGDGNGEKPFIAG
jgi:4-diphosphocytidyl-2-C-methyl-D-erythritol kinase